MLDTMLPANLANETERSAAVVGLAGWLSDRDRRQDPVEIEPGNDRAEIPLQLNPPKSRTCWPAASSRWWSGPATAGVRHGLAGGSGRTSRSRISRPPMTLRTCSSRSCCGQHENRRSRNGAPARWSCQSMRRGRRSTGFSTRCGTGCWKSRAGTLGLGPTTMQGRLNAWVRAKAEREAAERAAEAARLKAEADAELGSRPGPGRRRRRRDRGRGRGGNGEADAARATAAPARDMARSTTARGTTLGLRANWTFEVADFDLLVLAAAKPAVIGRLMAVPALREFHDQIERALRSRAGRCRWSYLAPNDPVIRAAVKGERGRRRDRMSRIQRCPGFAARRMNTIKRRPGPGVGGIAEDYPFAVHHPLSLGLADKGRQFLRWRRAYWRRLRQTLVDQHRANRIHLACRSRHQ